MARLSATKLEVNEEQQAELETIVRKHTSPQRLVVRARIILLAMAGFGVHETMRRLGIARTTVRNRQLRGVLPRPRENRTIAPMIHHIDGSTPWHRAHSAGSAAAHNGNC